MRLHEIYQKGAKILERSKTLGMYLRGVETEYVVKNNEEIFKRYRFRQRAINSIESITKTKILDVDLDVPVIMSSITAPIPQIVPDGLLKVARALKQTGSMMSTGTPIPANLDQLVEVGVPLLQTIKPYADRSRVMELISRAEDAGVTWVGIEVDAGQGTKVLDRQRVRDCTPMSISELKEIKKKVSRPLVLKGILSQWDAGRALEVGADVIVVSNHGAHTVDYLPHPLEVLEEITGVVANRIPIIVDGGFRRGTDVLKGLALGAQAIGLGRSILYGLAADGEEGVKAVITEIAVELRRTMTMTGVSDPASAHKGIIL